MDNVPKRDPEKQHHFINRELAWLAFARRVLAQVERADLPLLERLKFAGIMGMLHDEFFMKRMNGLLRQMRQRPDKLSIDGRKPAEEYEACEREIRDQISQLDRMLQGLRRDLATAGTPILEHSELAATQKEFLRGYFERSVQPILTPLAVDAGHPFPFISNAGINLAVLVPDGPGLRRRFVRVKVPDNRPRWVELPGGGGFVALEQVIAANLDLVFPDEPPDEAHFFRVTRGAEGALRAGPEMDLEEAREPGSIVRQVSSELRARRFAGAVRLQVTQSMPTTLVSWLTEQLGIGERQVYRSDSWLGLGDLMRLDVEDRDDLRLPRLEPVTHPRLRGITDANAEEIFEEIRRGDILVHHPYNSFDTSVLRLIQAASVAPEVLAIKLTIYRTSKDSPIVRALAEAARRGKQVAVLVEITARFDEAPNIAWGRYLEQEGVHVAYGVESLKTHVKLALVVAEENGQVRNFAHVGTGNYHTGTARIYEDLGILTCEPDVCADVAAVFNELTSATPFTGHRRLLVAPRMMRIRFVELIRREAEHAREGRPSGIRAKMNQLQDHGIISELYAASQDGVPITLNVRGLSCLRPGVEGVSENIRLFGIVDRFLEHSRIYRFENGGQPEVFIGSADWMSRNLNKRVETITPVLDPQIRDELSEILGVYESDNCSAWDCHPDGSYTQRQPDEGEERRAAQEIFIQRATAAPHSDSARDRELAEATV